MPTVSLSAFRASHTTLLTDWLRADHVAPWFPHSEDDIHWANALPANGRQYLVCVDEQPAGYIRWSYVAREILDTVGLYDIPANAADIDILLGERQSTGRGIAGEVLRLALTKIRSEGIATLAALTTSRDNLVAQKAFKRAGFSRDREYEPADFGPCYLMLKSV